MESIGTIRVLHYTVGNVFVFFAHLSAQVHDIGVRVVKWQKNAVAGVHLLDVDGLVHVILRTRGLGKVNVRNATGPIVPW